MGYGDGALATYSWSTRGKVSYWFWWIYAQKNTGLQGSTLSIHHMTMGFSTFKVACTPVFSRSTNLESKLIKFFVFVNF